MDFVVLSLMIALPMILSATLCRIVCAMASVQPDSVQPVGWAGREGLAVQSPAATASTDGTPERRMEPTSANGVAESAGYRHRAGRGWGVADSVVRCGS